MNYKKTYRKILDFSQLFDTDANIRKFRAHLLLVSEIAHALEGYSQL